ncbi:MAG: NAD(P)-dependent oxidoreductase [Verrucomicrobiota bacterium]
MTGQASPWKEDAPQSLLSRAKAKNTMIIELDAPILVTGAAGFIGTKVVESLLDHGFRNLRCFARPSSNSTKLEVSIRRRGDGAHLETIKGDLLSREDCLSATKDVAVIYHLAAGRGTKSFPDAFLNSVVTTRNLLEAARRQQCLKRFVSISSFSVYSNTGKPQGRLLDESCPVESRPERRGDAYCFAKVKQDEIVAEYGKKFGIPYVIVRPGVVYGPGNEAIHGRVGIGTFGLFLHLGGSNAIPFTYVDNCAEAIVLAGIKPGVNGETFNVVDDDLPSSREFLRLYKKNVRRFRSVYVPHGLSYLLCWLWEKYSHWSEGQLPPTFNRAAWHNYWKTTYYRNDKIKRCLGWTPKVSSVEALERYFDGCRRKVSHA